jgi:hypothetical protein
VLEGELEFDRRQAADENQGSESYQIPKAQFTMQKAGDKPFKVLGVYVVKAGEPLAKPAP